MKELRHFYIHNLILALVSFEEVLGVCVFRHAETVLACMCLLSLCLCHLLTERGMHRHTSIIVLPRASGIADRIARGFFTAWIAQNCYRGV